jgi:hypothetical protein
VTCVFSDAYQGSEQLLVSIKRPDCSGKLDEYRRIQEVSLRRLKEWFEDFVCAECSAV